MADLRIIRINYNPPDIEELGYRDIFEKVREVTIIKPLMQTFERFILVCEVIWQDGPDLSFLDSISLLEKAEVITTEGDRSLVMVHGNFPQIYSEALKAFFETFNCFLEFPARFTEKAMTGAIVGTKEDINRFLSFAEEWGATYEVVSVKRYQPQVQGVLSKLTPKQFHSLETAVRLGYFDVPRKISSRQLAKEIGISHATVLEHIKKGQREIYQALFKE